MSIRSWTSRALTLLLAAATAASIPACAPVDEETEGADPDAITSASAVARTLTLNGYVYLPVGSSETTIVEAVRRQTRSSFGPLRNLKIGLDDREVRTIDTNTFVRDTVTVVDTDHPGSATRQMLRVRYRYQDRAVVDNSLSRRRSIPTTVLLGDYMPHGSELIDQCTDDPEAREFGASGLWYMFNPGVESCQARIRQEVSIVSYNSRLLTDRRTQVSATEVNRLFLPVTVTLAAIRAPQTPKYPEYDRLLGAGDARKTEMNVYAFFGVIGESETSPSDEGYLEMMRVLRTFLQAYPRAQFTSLSPTGNLLDIRVGGTLVPNATYTNVLNWAIDGRAPTGFSITALRTAIASVWRRRTIQLSVPMTVTAGGSSHPLSVNLRAYYGNEGDAWSPDARRRYVSAWRDADVFIYSGHSHLGSGPLDPGNFSASDFPDRYQIMMINSCVSYNYYNAGYYPLHPGGTANLDMVVNGTEALGDNGWAVSRFILGLVNGRQQSYIDLMRSMIATDLSIGLDHYDPLRVADGELDNRYSPTRTPITLTATR